MLKCLVFTLLATVTLMSAVGPKKDETDAVAQAVEKLRKAMIDPDKKALDAIASDKLSYGHSSGKIEEKAAFMEAFLSGNSDFKAITLTDQTITVVDNTATVRHTLSAETNDKGVAGKVKLAVLLVWVKQKGDWKLLARQAVKLAQ
ncbi:nuclear transport factor 2 family protein [Tellurirhabdus bombi]|uniref:nuclear transport factor 2 family protein n=1 Tax=Tellurirhabdus bombi TaxID=2907205 RepID=UPI00286D8D92|nr:nuclear transport factor 2 family protein [Tellurirhabdus bombi]